MILKKLSRRVRTKSCLFAPVQSCYTHDLIGRYRASVGTRKRNTRTHAGAVGQVRVHRWPTPPPCTSGRKNNLCGDMKNVASQFGTPNCELYCFKFHKDWFTSTLCKGRGPGNMCGYGYRQIQIYYSTRRKKCRSANVTCWHNLLSGEEFARLLLNILDESVEHPQAHIFVANRHVILLCC